MRRHSLRGLMPLLLVFLCLSRCVSITTVVSVGTGSDQKQHTSAPPPATATEEVWKPGDNCLTNGTTACGGLDGAKCWNSTCVCDNSHYANLNQTSCLPLSSVSSVTVEVTSFTNTSISINWTQPNITSDFEVFYNVTWIEDPVGENDTARADEYENLSDSCLFPEFMEDLPEPGFTPPTVTAQEQYPDTLDSSTETSNTTDIIDQNYTIEGLSPGHRYKIVVTPGFKDGLGLQNKTLNGSKICQITVPNPPTVRVSKNYGPVVTLNFTNEGLVDYCNVTILEPKTENVAVEKAPNCRSVVIHCLQESVTYTVNISAVKDGARSYGRSFTFETSSSAVTSLKHTEVTDQSALVSWSAPETDCWYTDYQVHITTKEMACSVYLTWVDHMEPAAISLKQSEVSNGESSCQESKPIRFSESLNIQKLQPCTNYSVTVAGVNADCLCNCSGAAERTVFRTRPSPPVRVKDLHVYSVDNSTLSVTWEPPGSPACELKAYTVKVVQNDGTCYYTNITLMYTDKQSSLDQECQTHLAVDESSIKAFTVGGLLPDTMYKVTVSAVNEAGKGTPATKTNKTDIAFPEKPSDPSVTVLNATAVQLQWTPPHPRPGPTNYTLNITDLGSEYYSDSNSQEAKPMKHCHGYNTSSYVLAGLSAAWRYNVSLVASTTAGSSPPVYFDTIETKETDPGPIQNLTVEAVGDFYTVQVSWLCPKLPQRNTNITGFRLHVESTPLWTSCRSGDVGTDTGPDTDVADLFHCAQPFHTNVSITPEYNYTFQVITIGSGYNRTTGDNVTYDAPPGPSSAVQNLRADVFNVSSVSVTWRPPDRPSGCLTAYVIELTTTDGNCTQGVVVSFTYVSQVELANHCANVSEVRNVTGNDTSVVVEYLLPAVTYNVTVTPQNANGSGETNWTQITTPSAVPNPPSGQNSTVLNDTAVLLRWTPPYPYPGPTNYTLSVTDLGSKYYTDTETTRTTMNVNDEDDEDQNKKTTEPSIRMKDSDWQILVEDHWSSSYVLSNLSAAWRYNVSIVASTDAGSSSPVSFETFATNDTEPGPMQELTAESVGDLYTVNISWRCPELRQRNTNITGFVLRVNITPPWDSCPFGDVGTHSWPDTYVPDLSHCGQPFHTNVNITPEYNYTFQVTTIGDTYNSTIWSKAEYTALPGPSSAVSWLGVDVIDDKSVNIMWRAPERPNGCLTAYIIRLEHGTEGCVQAVVFEQTTEDIDPQIENCTRENRFNFSKALTAEKVTAEANYTWIAENLTAEATYTVSITPYNAAGSGETTSVNAAMRAGQSEPVSNLTVIDQTNVTVTVAWSPPHVTYGHLTAYVLQVTDNSGMCINKTVFSNNETAQAENDATCQVFKTERFPEISQFSYTVTELLPDSDYNITVFPVNNWGNGKLDNVSAHTNESVPNQPTNVNTNNETSDRICVSWTPPEPRPGETIYTLKVLRARNPYGARIGHDVNRTIEITGWNTSSHCVDNLSSGWEYVFHLTTSTSVGSSGDLQIGPVHTLQTAPERVRKLNVTRRDDYWKAVVTWYYPEVEDWHGNITNFTLTYGQSNDEAPYQTYTIDRTELPFGNGSQIYTVHVVPGQEYSFQIRANNEHQGAETSLTYKAPVGVPPSLLSLPVFNESLAHSQSAFTIMYCVPCLLDKKNGEIIFIAVVVCPVDQCTDELKSVDDAKNLSSWHQAKKQDFRISYRATNDTWLDKVRTLAGMSRRRRRRAVHEVPNSEFVVGEDNDCPNRPENTYCNGPLPAGRKFQTRFISCTSTGCAASPPSVEMVTLDPPSSIVPQVAGGLAGAVAALALVVFILWYRRRKGAKECDGHPEGEEELHDITTRSRPILMRDFEDTLTRWKQEGTDEKGVPNHLVNEYQEIKDLSPNHPRDVAVMEGNRVKNRYTNILAFTHSRVKLNQIDDYECSDYINANYIPGYTSKREYIATQGPLHGTCNDFWRMVWEQKSEIIVMLSPIAENNKEKVYKYFPDEDEMSEPKEYGMVTVTLQAVRKYPDASNPDYLVRIFQLRVGSEQRTVKQFFTDKWMDFSANLTINMILDLVRAIRAEVPPGAKQPIVVHCSAGVGRTGTLIAVDYFMQYVRDKTLADPIDIFAYVMLMRENRVLMVQTKEQYLFVFDTVAELIKRKTEVHRYDEPAYGNIGVYANMGFEPDEPAYANVSFVPKASSSSSEPTTPRSTASQSSSPETGIARNARGTTVQSSQRRDPQQSVKRNDGRL